VFAVLKPEGRQVADAFGSAAQCKKLDLTDKAYWVATMAAACQHCGEQDWPRRASPPHAVNACGRTTDRVVQAQPSGASRRRRQWHPVADLSMKHRKYRRWTPRGSCAIAF
jgi:hypothetical protein